MTEAEAAIAAGASYVVSPVFIPDILRCCQKAGVLYAPGALTPSEIFRAVDAGAKVVKVFPASAVTPNYIRDVLQPFRGLHPILMLTGGLDRAQIPAYLAVGIAIVGVGGAILARDELAAKQYDRIGERAREIRLVVESARS
jgi:2-dehydro-3-deoxyphosphogluconate aldolase/(4S)-4-hydroxy-2-oxoglutarate aldolase